MAIVIEIIDAASESYRYSGQFRCGHDAPKNEGRGFGMDFDAIRAQARINQEDGVCYHCYSARGSRAGTYGTCDAVCDANGFHPR